MVDKESLMRRLGGKTALLAKVVEQFNKTYDSQMAVVREAIRNQDGETLGRASHRLKGAVAYFEDAQVNEAASRLVTLAAQQDFTTAPLVYQRLDLAMKLLRQNLQSMLVE